MTTKTNEGMPSRPLARWAAGVGLVLLIVSFAVASMAMNPSRADGTSSATTPPHGKRAVAVAHVDVEGGVRSLYPVRLGRVVELPFKEGDPVPMGKVLLRIDDKQARFDLARARNALAMAREKRVQADVLVKQHGLKAAAMRSEVQVQEAEWEAAKAVAAKAKRFREEKLGGSTEDVLAAEKLAEKAARAIKAKQAALDAFMGADPQAAVRMANMDVADKERLVELAELALAEHEVKAPMDGSLLRVGTAVGETLGPNPQRPALLFCPAGERIVRAEVEQEFAAGVAVSQLATIQDDATGDGEWKGKVVRISDWYTHRRSILLEPLQFNDVRTLEVIISVEPGGKPLRIGQRLRVLLQGAP